MGLQRSEDAHEELLQERLRILLDRLRWSYATLWTLDPRTRVLEWKRGHFEVANTKAGAREYAQLFYTTYKSCRFTPGVGAVGRANLEGKHIWLTGDAVCQHAGSVEQSQFLRCAEIKTTICIPWVDSVLEIGTISVVAENLVLTDRIQQVLANDLLSVPVAPESASFEHTSQSGPGTAAISNMFPGFRQDSAAPRVDHPTNLALQPPSSIQRLPSPIPSSGGAPGHLPLAERVWRTSTSDTLYSQLPRPRNLNLIRRTNSCGDQYEIQKYHTLFEAQEMHERWRQQLNPEPEPAANTDATVAKTMATEPCNLPTAQNLPFQGWQRDVGSPAVATLQNVNTSDPSKKPTVKRSNVEIMNKVSKIAGPLLRRQSLSALELLKDVEKYQKEAAEVPYDGNPVQVCWEPSRPVHVEINRPNPRGQPRTMGVEQGSGSGPVHAGHDEAAVSHMLAERRRRMKQKENFSTLRRLVPIISKADKASTLIDTIAYLKFLQNKIHEMEASKEDIDQRCEILETRCKDLRERNQALVAMISKDEPGSAIHLNLVHLKLQSMDSI